MHTIEYVDERVKTPESPVKRSSNKSDFPSRSGTPNSTSSGRSTPLTLSRPSSKRDVNNIRHAPGINILPDINKKKYDIDFIGTGTAINIHNILQRRSVEPVRRAEAQLSARGLKHRTSEYFERDVVASTNFIHNQLRLGARDSKDGMVSGQQLLNVYFQRALGHERLGNTEKALQDYSTVIKMRSDYAPAYFNRSSLLDSRGDLDGAARDLLKAVTLDPNNITYRTNRAVLLRRRGDYKEAIKETVLCRAMRENPNKVGELADGEQHASEVSVIPEDPVIAILSAPHKERKNVDAVSDFLRASVKFFAGFKDDPVILEKISKRLDLSYYSKGDFVFKTGDLGDRFYVVFDGECQIVLTKENSEKQHIVLKHLVTIVRGGTFGETALAKQGGLRSAAAMAAGKVTLLSLHVDDYNSIVSQYKAILRNEIKIVLASSAAFLDWEADRIEALANEAVVMNFTANQTLVRAGEPSKKLYIIKHGVAQIIKSVHHPLRFNAVNERPRYDATGVETPGLWILDKNWKDRMNTFDKAPAPGADGEVDVTAGDPNMEPFTVGVLGSGQVFGELAILDPEKLCPVSVVSCTNMELYCFDSDLLISLGARFNGTTINALNESMNLCNVRELLCLTLSFQVQHCSLRV